MVDKLVTWRCEHCMTVYADKQHAKDCEATPIIQPFPDINPEPGQFVVPTWESTAWVDKSGPSDWVQDRGEDFKGASHHDHRYRGIFYVTAIAPVPSELGQPIAHKLACHLYHGGGWTGGHEVMIWMRRTSLVRPLTILTDDKTPANLLSWRAEHGQRLIGNVARKVL